MLPRAQVIDTAVWRFAVFIATSDGSALDFTGSTFEATIRPTRGGPPAAVASTADGSLSFVPASGQVSAHFYFNIPPSARTWKTVRPTTLLGDIKRVADPLGAPTVEEWTLPFEVSARAGSDSDAIGVEGYEVLLLPNGPYDYVSVGTAAVGPQGPGPYDVLDAAQAPILPGQALTRPPSGVGLVPASSATFSSSYVVGLAGAAVAAGYPVIAHRERVTLQDWSAATGSASLVAGRDYFLAAEPGRISLVPDIALGHSTVRLGIAITADTLAVELSPPFLN